MQKAFRIPLDVYNTEAAVVITDSSEFLRRKLKGWYDGRLKNLDSFDWNDMSGYDGICYSLKYKEGGKMPLIVFPDGISRWDKARMASVVAHECYHASMLIFDSIGHIPKEGSQEEPFAYLLGHLVKNIVARIMEKKEKPLL